MRHNPNTKSTLCLGKHCDDVLYYYHSDHIGSSTFLTDALGIPYETPTTKCWTQRNMIKGVPSVHNKMHSESAKLNRTDEFMLYLPFGEAMAQQKVAGWGTPYTFTGKEQDAATGLHYFGARYLDTRLSMWFGVDPLAEKYPGYSPFNYVLNNPIRLIDPTGMSPEDNDWIPEVNENGDITLTPEAGDNLKTLKHFLKGSDIEKEAENIYNNRSKDGTVTLPSDNYSNAFKYSIDNKDEFTFEISDHSKENYNCYHFALNGIWENEIYSFFGSSGSYEMTPERFANEVEKHFIPTVPGKAIFGETLIGMNYSGGYAQHSAVYAGTSRTGEIYIMQKPGMSLPPNIIPLKDAGSGMHNDFRFFNEKGSQIKIK